MKSSHRIAIILATALMLTILNATAREQTAGKDVPGTRHIKGAGSTFIAPLGKSWIEDYENLHPELRIGYDAVGSGEGVHRFVKGEVDFAASDGGMTDAQIAKVDRGVRFIPATIGSVVLAYNIKGVTAGLKLARDVYVDIFAGKIRTWDDPRIKAANPELALPHENIALVVRQDGSGTTYAFTNHLGAISETWRDGPGVGTVIEWPGNAMVARGNEGVAARIRISEGAIGYVEYGFAHRLGLPMAALQNNAGQFVVPDVPSIAKVFADSVDRLPNDLRLLIPDPAGEGVYPIATFSWLILYGHYPAGVTGSALTDFVRFGLTKGQEDSVRLGYVPLPEIVSSLAQMGLDTVDTVQ